LKRLQTYLNGIKSISKIQKSIQIGQLQE